MEGKYGRLFTEQDVKLMLADAIEQAWNAGDDEALGPITDRVLATASLTFPADEPMFLLRGQDKAAPDTISMYWEICMGFGDPIEEGECSDAHCDAVRDAGEALDAWQKANPERVKVPD